jgi:hypothetical protein
MSEGVPLKLAVNAFDPPLFGRAQLTHIDAEAWECSGWHYQVSLTAGLVLHKTHTPLHLWFWAAYLMTTATQPPRP